MTGIQFIERDGKREFAVVPIAIFERLAALVEDAEDAALLDLAKAADDGFRVPSAVANAVLDGMHPIRAWREYRGFTQEALAAQAGISKAYLSQLENGKRAGAFKTLRRLAGLLGVTAEDLHG